LEIYIICVIQVLDRIYVTFLSHINPKLGMQHYIPQHLNNYYIMLHVHSFCF